ncbi:MAG: sigma-54-dependent transcriptional regulator [Planctomycetaceae bacterium]
MNEPVPHRLRVLFVDDEQAIRDVLGIELPRMGHDVTLCEDGESAIRALDTQSFDAAVIDLRMPGLSGWDVIEHLKQVAPETEFVISTGHGDLEDAIRAIRQGAYDFLPKPCQLFEIANVLQQIGEKRALTNRAIALENRLASAEGKTVLVGSTRPMRHVQKLIDKVAPTDSTVLILGETGTGKELVARSIHERSSRAAAPFVPVNCGALPQNLVESEFFGHRKGAFTGADAPRKGLFEVANGGTLFLDELGELDKSMQVKLLRFLESGEIRRLGENEPFHVDVRIVCATNRDLREMVSEGGFRDDLFFRINTFEIRLPPLRERREDIPEISRHLVARHLQRCDVPGGMLSPDAIEALMNHEWSGNVRELANALEHALILYDGETILAEDLPGSVGVGRPATVPIGADRGPRTLREIEMDVILSVLEKHKGDKPKAAKELGIALKTLYNKLNQHQTQKQAG